MQTDQPTPTREMLAMAKAIADQTVPEDADGYATHADWQRAWYIARDAALLAIQETSELAATFAAWAHMVPPDGGSPTTEEVELAANTANGLRTFAHLKDTDHD